jgi:hypothetical protein
MMRVVTALALVAAVALAGCGSDKKTIPNSDGASLIRLLRQARDETGDPQKCPQLLTTVQRVQTRVASLPSSVDKNTRDSLVNGVNNLIDDSRNECANTQTTPTETAPTTPTQTAPTQTTPPTDTTPTQSTPTQTTPTTPTPTTPTTPSPGNGGTSPGNGGTPPGQGNKKDKGAKGDGKKGNG